MNKRGFTLIEMLVVLGIVAILAALIIPAGAIAVRTTRDANMSFEIAQLAQAIETYKKEKGDYPPSLGEDYSPANRYLTVCERHIRKCFPKIDRRPGGELDVFYNTIAPRLSGDEALVFWLALTQNDERQPFTSAAKNFKRFYDFPEERFQDFDGDGFPSYLPRYSGEKPFVYFDSRTYLLHQTVAGAVGGEAQPYGNFAAAQKVKALGPPANQLEINRRKQSQYCNPTTFQIVCAGQDREFGPVSDQFDPNGYPREVFQQPPLPNEGLRQFKDGIVYNDGDFDNLTNFSEGRRLMDHMP